MSKFSDYLEEKILDATLNGQSFPSIPTAYLAAFSTDATDAGTGTECSWTNYARQAMTFGVIGAVSNGQVDTSTQIQFPALEGSDVTVGWIGIYDAATGGNLLYHTNLANPKTLTVDDVLSFAASGVTVTLA
jgi:hypothetical protein